MGFRGELHGSSPEPLMSALGQKQTLRSATSVSAKCQIQIEVSSEPTNARRSESPSLPLRRPGTLREHPVRS